MLKLALFPALALLGVVVGDQCPPRTLTRPCDCDPSAGLTLICDNIKSRDVLEGVFRRTGSVPFGHFQLNGSVLPSVPLKNSFVAFDVFESNLTTLFDAPPDPDNVVRMLSLEKVKFQGGVPWQQFRNLKKLRFLSLFEVDVPSLDSRFKSNVDKGLKLLMLQKTNTGRLEDGIFAEFKALHTLLIKEGQLRELERSYFPRPSILKNLKLDGNQISFLSDDMFADMPELETLSLKGNRLSTISEEVFGDVFDQLTTLDVNDNPIRCDCDIQWMTSRDNRGQLRGQCESPENFKGKSLKELQSSDFDACQ